MDELTLPGLPSPLHWLGAPATASVDGNGALRIAAGPRTDLFVDPGGGEPDLSAPCLALGPTGDFRLSARVDAALVATFDAGALLVRAGERTWGKLCLELSPAGRPTIVSVVTRDLSDDCNSWEVDASAAWLRIARLGGAIAFHASADGELWRLVRWFALDGVEAAEVGFVAQSPTGAGCIATFSDVRFAAGRLADIRDGS